MVLLENGNLRRRQQRQGVDTKRFTSSCIRCCRRRRKFALYSSIILYQLALATNHPHERQSSNLNPRKRREMRSRILPANVQDKV